jgi:hypothetical protein
MDPFVASTASEPVKHLVCTGTDSYNQGIYDAPPVDYLCISEGKINVIRNMEGEQVVTALRLYISGKVVVTPKDKFVFDGVTYPILARSFFKGNGIPGYVGTTVVYL